MHIIDDKYKHGIRTKLSGKVGAGNAQKYGKFKQIKWHVCYIHKFNKWIDDFGKVFCSNCDKSCIAFLFICLYV